MAAQSSIAGTTPITSKVGRVRFLIVLMLFVVTMVNYADRATISIAGPALLTIHQFSTRPTEVVRADRLGGF